MVQRDIFLCVVQPPKKRKVSYSANNNCNSLGKWETVIGSFEYMVHVFMRKPSFLELITFQSSFLNQFPIVLRYNYERMSSSLSNIMKLVAEIHGFVSLT